MQPLTVKDFLEQLREAGVKKISEIIWIIDADGDLEISEVGMPNSMRNIFLSMKKIADQTDYKSKFGDLLSENSKKEPTKSELLDKLIKMCKPGSGVRIALEEIKDKFALDEADITQGSIAAVAAETLREGGYTVVVLGDDEIQMCDGPKQPPDEDQISSMLARDGIEAQKVLNGIFKLDWVDSGSGEIDDVYEKEEILPDSVVNEAVETLRRMY